MKYKIGDEVLVKARIISGSRKYFGVEVEGERFDVYEDNIVPVPDMTAEEAWEIAKKIILPKCCGGLSSEEFGNIFGEVGSEDVFKDLPMKHVKKKIEEWEAEKEIKVGDEVDICGDKGIVTSFGTDGNRIHVLYYDGIVNSYRKDKDIKKTGRHIDIDGFLKQIGETDA